MEFNEYGVFLNQFFVTTILKPDGDAQYEKFKELVERQGGDVSYIEAICKING